MNDQDKRTDESDAQPAAKRTVQDSGKERRASERTAVPDPFDPVQRPEDIQRWVR